ncbi:helicase [Sarracenia purpurea var. burkii]
MVESIAGAILLDTKLNLDEVWRIFKPLLSPIVTPEKLELPPLRELIELCDSLGYFIKENCMKTGELVHAELRLQLKDVLLLGEGFGHNKKAAKGQAAFHLLKDLESRGISYSKRRKQSRDGFGLPSALDLGNSFSSQPNADPSEPVAQKKQKTIVTQLHSEPSNGCSLKSCDSEVNIPILSSINMKKGGPRTSLYVLCKKLQWPMPTFNPTEEKSRTPVEFFEGSEKRTAFNTFTSRISLTIPDLGVIELTGDQRPDKKSSFDSAALVMLYELQRLGKLVIGGV